MFIESRTNTKIKNIVKLRNRAKRESSHLFFFEGAHLLEEYLRFGHMPYALFISEKSERLYSDLINKIDKKTIYIVTENIFSKISTEKSPQGILTVSKFIDDRIILVDDNYEQLTKNQSYLFLESVRDNGNVGTIIRTAAALGITCVLSKDCADIYSNKTIRASMGAIFSRKTYIANDFYTAVNTVKKSRRVFSTTLGESALTLGKFEIKPKDSFVIGNEGRGISKETAALCDLSVKIPMSDAAESLNASQSAAILIWEMYKASKTDKPV